MIDKLDFIEKKYIEIEKKLSDPEIISDQDQYVKLSKEYSEITPIVNKYKEYLDCKNGIEESKDMIEDDGELAEILTEYLANFQIKTDLRHSCFLVAEIGAYL